MIFTSPLLLASACLARVAEPPISAPPAAPIATATAAPPACTSPDLADDVDAPLTDRVDGCFQRGPRGDRDRYRGVVPGGGPQRVTVAIERGETTIGIRYAASDRGGRDLGGGFTTDPRREFSFNAVGGAPFQLVVGTGAFGRDDERYRITMTTVADDRGEPDDRIEDAQAATAQPIIAHLTGRLSPDGDVVPDLDHYRLDVARAGTLVLEATQVERARVRLTLLDGDGRRVGAPAVRRRGDDVTLSAAVAPGTYVVRVDDASGAPQATELRGYRLAVRLP